jgi:hypothetical protein
MNKPIPEGTVKVFFYIIQGEDDDYEIEFNFENESLRHTPDKTMRSNMYQVGRSTLRGSFALAVTLTIFYFSNGSTA